MKFLTAFLFAAITFSCLTLRPLWVDEIFQLEGTWQQSYPQMFHNAMIAPGGMPLAYAAQKLCLDVAGLSSFSARVPAACFGLGTLVVLFWTARFLKMNAGLALLLGFVTPLLFRYSTEGRPYSQGLFFSALSTALFLSWYARPSALKLTGYFLTCLVGVYSQPFSLFVPCAHAAYMLMKNRKRLFAIAAVLVCTGAIYAPWVLASRKALLSESWPHEMFFSLAQISPLMIVREISGGGYVCSLALLILAIAGLPKNGRGLMIFCVALPIVLAIGADAAFHYFFAIRQLIFVLPPLLLLATAGAIELWERSRFVAMVLTGAFVIGALVKDVRWQADREEDWGKAAGAIQAYLNNHPGCVEFLPPGDARHYFFFEAALRARSCGANPGTVRAMLAVSPYAAGNQRQPALHSQNVGNTLLETN